MLYPESPTREPATRRRARPALGARLVAPVAPVADRARCIAPLRTDGGTAFVLRTRREEWSLEFVRLIDLLSSPDRDPRELEDERREGTPIELPLPRGAVAPAPAIDPESIARRRWREVFEVGQEGEEHAEELEPWEWAEQYEPEVRPPVFWGWEDDRPFVLVRRTDTQSDRCWTFYAPDRCFAKLYERVSPEGEVEWWLRVECKARELYADGLRSWMTRWLGIWSWLLQGTWALPESADDCGWVCTQWHLNSDFARLEIYEADKHSFTGPRRMTEHARALRAEEHEAWSQGRKDGPWTQTLQFGRKASDVCLVVYRKGDQLREEKHVEPKDSMYAPLWSSRGWDPDADGDPLRVEWRLRKKGLRYQDRGRTRTVYDFRKPHMLLDETAVHKFWAHLCDKRRLIVHDRSRKEDCSNDPRWDVIAAASSETPPDIRQIPHEVRFKTRDEREGKHFRAAFTLVQKYALDHGAICRNEREAGIVLMEMAQRMIAGDLEVARQMATNPHPFDVRAVGERYRPAIGFYAIEAASHYPSFCARVGQRLPFVFEKNREHLVALAYLWGRAPPTEERPMSEQEYAAQLKIQAARAGVVQLCRDHGEAAEAAFFEMTKSAQVQQMVSTPGVGRVEAALASMMPKDEPKTPEERKAKDQIDAARAAIVAWLGEHGEAAEAVIYDFTTTCMTGGDEAAVVEAGVPIEYARSFASGVPAAVKHVGRGIFDLWSAYMQQQLFSSVEVN